MVQISTTVVVAALAIAPALAAPVAFDEFETRDVQDLEARRRTSSGVSSTLGRFVGGLWGQRQQSQEPAARDFIDVDAMELETRNKRGRRNQRQSTGFSSSAGNFVGSALGSAASSVVNGARDFVDLETLELEARNRKSGRRNQRQSTGFSSSVGNFVGSALGSAAGSMMNGARDFVDLETLELEARNRRSGRRNQRQSSGFSSSVGNFVGSALGSAAGSMMNGARDFIDLETLELEARNRRSGRRNQRQSSGFSSSAGNFVGSALGSAASSMNGARDFVDLDFDIDARWINELD